MELFHVSYKKIDSFTPRIPQSRADGENASVPRICFAETIEQCVNAKPSGLGPILSGLMNNLPVLLYVYSIHTEDYPAELLLHLLAYMKICPARMHLPTANMHCSANPKRLENAHS